MTVQLTIPVNVTNIPLTLDTGTEGMILPTMTGEKIQGDRQKDKSENM